MKTGIVISTLKIISILGRISLSNVVMATFFFYHEVVLKRMDIVNVSTKHDVSVDVILKKSQ